MLDTRDTSSSDNAVAADLVARIRRGDPAAEAALVRCYGNGLLILLRRLTGDPELAHDLRQDVLRIALERLRSQGIDEPERLAGWLAGTARKLALAEIRKQARRRTYTNMSDAEDNLPAEQESQLQALERDELVALVRQLISELPNRRDRELLFCYYVGDEDKEVLCERFGLSAEHFHRVLFRARQRFRALYEARFGEQDFDTTA